MFSHFQQQIQQQQQTLVLQNPIWDALYCDEERLDDDSITGFCSEESQFEGSNEFHKKPFALLLFEHDLIWEDDEVVALLSKEKKQAHLSFDEIISDGSLRMVRNEGIKWMMKVVGHYGFNAMTGVLAVNYYDRFVRSVGFQKDKPWMSQLAAVACLSVAAKVEETQVPLLMELQVEESKYVFEAKTIQRMELLVLSTLQWKMNPVTPIAYLDHIVRRFELLNNLHSEFLRRCEAVLISIVTDCRLVNYLPSVIAAATMIYVIRDIEPCDAMDYENQLTSVLRTSKERVDGCYKLIMELMDDCRCNHSLKRKHELLPSSPSGVIDSYFSSDSSNDSWAVAQSLASSPEPLSKKTRVQWRG